MVLVPLSLALPVSTSAAELSDKIALELEKPAHIAPWQRYKGWDSSDWKNYNNLAQEVSPPVTPPQKFSDPLSGDAEKGQKLVADRSRGGSCYACHVMPGANLPGNVGPDLSTVATWQRTDEHLFNYIYDARNVNPNTVMPPWGTHQVFTPEEIKDMVAYLKTLTTATVFKSSDEDPAKRPVPVEHRDNLDEFTNPAMLSIEVGKNLFNQVGPMNKSCKNCHDDPKELFKTWATTMPQYEPRLKKMVGIEELITRHARATTGADYPVQTEDNLSLAIYLRYLANGQPIAIVTDDANTQAALKRAEILVKRKVGQLNFACTDCHTVSANKWIRGQYLANTKAMLDHFPTYRTSRTEIWDIRKRIQWCNIAVRANELPPDAPEYGDLELYLAVAGQGQKLSVPGIRH
ncbi:MAG: sulfur oxidation c-type cytochrome SoxX [Beggiatoa sp. IS2]|nr:MAG: sulfur oxidation c-type cytochrome SoxX [Beggiatoa sp. IS2]